MHFVTVICSTTAPASVVDGRTIVDGERNWTKTAHNTYAPCTPGLSDDIHIHTPLCGYG